LERLGVLYYRLPQVEGVDKLASERGYKNRDEITVSPEKMGDIYEDKVKSFFHEHLHEDEEIRYIRDGKGYFDVRSRGDEWVRIQLEKVRSRIMSLSWQYWRLKVFQVSSIHDQLTIHQDDLIVLPAGIYHRFTTDADNVTKSLCA
jgi:1,2-dihydroxy-3-keto-5-methylthiopentene dioxygenase